MSKNNLIQRLPVEVDPFRLVDQGRVLEGNIPLGDFPRLQEALFEVTDKLVRVRLEFTRTDTRLPIIKGHINVMLGMLCNRCLKSAEIDVETKLEVVLVSSDEQAESLQQGFDTWLVEDKQIFLRDFIEDELLLALPVVVAHEKCSASRKLIEAIPEEMAPQEEESPFAALKGLKLDK
jgi:uncharacterized protein